MKRYDVICAVSYNIALIGSANQLELAKFHKSVETLIDQANQSVVRIGNKPV
ncbi:hypothetical protein [Cohnella kolymensis]|uniref:hypothetical protein n=1 Tax=Cohnella kolymensis TaxID=1590652 RepID=UPI001F2BDF84|nr:hypothetical protein [Cohnella kolymensis]